MDTTDHHDSALGMRGPYDDDIDIGWVERRLNERAGSRSSRLSAYFEGVMEFVEPPPTISRSPTPEPRHQAAWQASPRYSHSVRPLLDHSFQRRSSGKGIPRIPSRRSTLESDSDSATGLPPRRRRRYVTPNPAHKHGYSHTTRIIKRYIRPSRPNTTSSKISSAHKMETRSKSRVVRRTGHSTHTKTTFQRQKAP
ncbi:hypothetical protein GLAREA_05773 [Glarea lozoyensis ATCC 20868]|uniref:Uncharacterized protein n=1 Tax=Glarea lozoyensis (strain ATCC 20868 / MF5171) TaxID=1116229 RepID=S3DF96_GLAL2|nr:uncharacterized protein GLAREA_05773 [Glarea lozoyensis ATCC 20868]EPE36435.1 hypothetical protein GLAREA_05773 [Glarea lozoyensis ATCC 20868]